MPAPSYTYRVPSITSGQPVPLFSIEVDVDVDVVDFWSALNVSYDAREIPAKAGPFPQVGLPEIIVHNGDINGAVRVRQGPTQEQGSGRKTLSSTVTARSLWVVTYTVWSRR